MTTSGAVTSAQAACRRPSLLLVEDDAELASLLRNALQEAASHVASADTAQLARQRLRSRIWDLVVLDVQLPDGDGFELCREVRGLSSATSVLMLTARASEADRVTGLELGAELSGLELAPGAHGIRPTAVCSCEWICEPTCRPAFVDHARPRSNVSRHGTLNELQHLQISCRLIQRVTQEDHGTREESCKQKHLKYMNTQHLFFLLGSN